MEERIPKEQPIVFINQSSGYLMIDIVNLFADAGYPCSMVAGQIVERNHPLNSKVKVHKIIRYNRNTVLKRVFTWGWGTMQIFCILLFRYRRAHLFIVSNPPFAPLLPLVLQNSFSLLIFDVYPDALTELGILKKRSTLIKLWKKANCKVFARAKNIFTIAEGMKEVLGSYAGDRQIDVVYVWTDNEFLKPIFAEDNPFIRQHNLIGKFVVLYSGNIGISNDVEVLADIAGMTDSQDIVFVIIGDGARKEKLERKIKKENIVNCLVLPWQDITQLPYSLSASNLAVVLLGKNVSKLAIPSKLYNLLSVGTPILGITSKDTDLHKLIERYEIGKCFETEQKEEMAAYILHLSNHASLCKNLSINAIKASQHYSVKNASHFLNAYNQI
jgi:glycosyltransferase involved in cell wall biosynthesis